MPRIAVACPCRRNSGTATASNVTAYTLEPLVEYVTYRHPPDDSFAGEGEQECRWNVIRRKIHALLPLFKYLQIPTERHSLSIGLIDSSCFRVFVDTFWLAVFQKKGRQVCSTAALRLLTVDC